MGLEYATQCLRRAWRNRDAELREQRRGNDGSSHEDTDHTHQGRIEGSDGGLVPPDTGDGVCDLRDLGQAVS